MHLFLGKSWFVLHFLILAKLLIADTGTVQTINYTAFINLKDVPEQYKKYTFIMVDCLNNVVLMENDPHKKTAPSSMTKVMTLYLLFDALRNGVVSPATQAEVSKEATKRGGTTMFLRAGEKVKISQLIPGIAVCSGNDAAQTAAEALSGTQEAFVNEMNYRAGLFFMHNTHFANASGWPSPEHYSTVYDLALLALNIINDFPNEYRVFSQTSIKHNGIQQYNSNKLIRHGVGVDGIKTGHTDAGGYGIIASVKNTFGRRLLLIINECKKESTRNKTVKDILRIGLQNFENYLILHEGEPAVTIPVWLGTSASITACPKENIIITTEKQNLKNIKISVSYDSPIKAPIKAGSVVAKLIISDNKNGNKMVHPLYANESVEEVNFIDKIKSIFNFVVFGL